MDSIHYSRSEQRQQPEQQHSTNGAPKDFWEWKEDICVYKIIWMDQIKQKIIIILP